MCAFFEKIKKENELSSRRNDGYDSGNDYFSILDEIRKLQEVTFVMKESIEKMSVSAGNITLTGHSLNNISSDMEGIISQIGQQVDKFSV